MFSEYSAVLVIFDVLSCFKQRIVCNSWRILQWNMICSYVPISACASSIYNLAEMLCQMRSNRPYLSSVDFGMYPDCLHATRSLKPRIYISSSIMPEGGNAHSANGLAQLDMIHRGDRRKLTTREQTEWIEWQIPSIFFISTSDMRSYPTGPKSL